MHFELSFGALLGRSSQWIPGQGHRGMQAFLGLVVPSCLPLGSLLLPSASCPHHESQATIQPALDLNLAEHLGTVNLAEYLGAVHLAEYLGTVNLAEYLGTVNLAEYLGTVDSTVPPLYGQHSTSL